MIARVEDIEPLPTPRLGSTLADYRRWQDFHAAIACALTPPPGILGGFEQAKIVTEDYQLVPVIRAFERPMQRILLADDVGLGKTIEAILIMLELRARGRGERILIVAPAGLQDQWALELQDKAGLTFEIFDSQRVLEIRQQLHVGRNPWAARRLIITSVDYVKRPDPKRALRDITWDLVVVDEAHYLSETSAQGRTYRTERSRFGTFIANQTDNLLLLTATPHNGDPQSLWSPSISSIRHWLRHATNCKAAVSRRLSCAAISVTFATRRAARVSTILRFKRSASPSGMRGNATCTIASRATANAAGSASPTPPSALR